MTALVCFTILRADPPKFELILAAIGGVILFGNYVYELFTGNMLAPAWGLEEGFVGFVPSHTIGALVGVIVGSISGWIDRRSS